MNAQPALPEVKLARAPRDATEPHTSSLDLYFDAVATKQSLLVLPYP